MPRKKLYVYYQPNTVSDCGDCTIRALSKVWDLSWADTFKRIIPICFEYQCPTPFHLMLKQRKEAMSKLGFDYTTVRVKKGSKRPTVWSFARDHQTGCYILNVANHEVAVVDGKYYDMWDSGDKSLYGWFEFKTK